MSSRYSQFIANAAPSVIVCSPTSEAPLPTLSTGVSAIIFDTHNYGAVVRRVDHATVTIISPIPDNCDVEECCFLGSFSARETTGLDHITVRRIPSQTSNDRDQQLLLLAIFNQCNEMNIDVSQSEFQLPPSIDWTTLNASVVTDVITARSSAVHANGNQFSFDVHCVCRRPYYLKVSQKQSLLLKMDPIVECSNCEKWFHSNCCKIDKKFIGTDAPWLCGNCCPLPAVPRWSCHIAENSCTVDNFLAAILVYTSKHPAIGGQVFFTYYHRASV
jgi:hypothetical protein